jgi:hypothetical protein
LHCSVICLFSTFNCSCSLFKVSLPFSAEVDFLFMFCILFYSSSSFVVDSTFSGCRT